MEIVFNIYTALLLSQQEDVIWFLEKPLSIYSSSDDLMNNLVCQHKLMLNIFYDRDSSLNTR